MASQMSFLILLVISDFLVLLRFFNLLAILNVKKKSIFLTNFDLRR